MTSMPTTVTGVADVSELATLLAVHGDALRPAEVVMQPERLGAARLTRHSFNRALLRRVSLDGWAVSCVELELDAAGCGRAVYRVEADGHEFHFVAFTTTLDEALHTDRVVAEGWEVTAALVEGELTEELLAELARAVPLQERARLDARVLVLTRGNRSVRFFEYLVDRLASGLQPDPDHVGDAGYIMRSTAFYANGKYGMRSFLGVGEDHPLRAPYRAQMLAAWLFRELSYDSVEACARHRGGDRAAQFDSEWRRFFGLGNATGLGLVPYFVKHPQIVNAWCSIRELALARVRALPGSEDRCAALRTWIDRAAAHFSTDDAADRHPWMSHLDLAAACGHIHAAFDDVAHAPHPFGALYDWAATQDVETCELVVSLLIELDDGFDDAVVDRLLRIDEPQTTDVAMAASDMTVGELRAELARRFGWLDGLDLDDERASEFAWVISDNTEEPRRAVRRRIDPLRHEVPIDVARRVHALRRAVDATPDDMTVGRFLVGHHEHAPAVARVVGADAPYGEARDNACAASFLPLQMQRFQLAMYGMDNFSPKSTDWLRVTLFQGAPRIADASAELADDWVWPARPAGAPAADSGAEVMA